LDLGTSPDGTATGRLRAGATDLKVSVTAPTADAFQINASIIDAGTAQDLADSQPPGLRVLQPLIETTAGSGDAYWGPTDPTTVAGGSALPVRTKLFVDRRQMQTAILSNQLTLALPAYQLTPRQSGHQRQPGRVPIPRRPCPDRLLSVLAAMINARARAGRETCQDRTVPPLPIVRSKMVAFHPSPPGAATGP
jgi:hypothetical protein